MAIFTRFSHLTLAATLLIGTVGICGNLVSVAIFARREVAINFTNLPLVSFRRTKFLCKFENVQARNCFSDILIALNLSDSVHIVLAMLENLRNCLEENYPAALIHIFPHFHYPFYRFISVYLMAKECFLDATLFA